MKNLKHLYSALAKISQERKDDLANKLRNDKGLMASIRQGKRTKKVTEWTQINELLQKKEPLSNAHKVTFKAYVLKHYKDTNIADGLSQELILNTLDHYPAT